MHAEFRNLVAGISEPYICDLLHVKPITLKRWKAGRARVPHAALLLLRLLICGDLAALSPAWQGFNLAPDGKLYAPLFKRGLSPEHVSSMFFGMQELRWLRVEVKKLRADLDASHVAEYCPYTPGKVQMLNSVGLR